jgi:hypothetical protein
VGGKGVRSLTTLSLTYGTCFCSPGFSLSTKRKQRPPLKNTYHTPPLLGWGHGEDGNKHTMPQFVTAMYGRNTVGTRRKIPSSCALQGSSMSLRSWTASNGGQRTSHPQYTAGPSEDLRTGQPLLGILRGNYLSQPRRMLGLLLFSSCLAKLQLCS